MRETVGNDSHVSSLSGWEDWFWMEIDGFGVWQTVIKSSAVAETKAGVL